MEGEAPRSWRHHPLLRRLPVLVLLAVALWWWKGARPTERELVWRLEGPGWSDIRSIDFQVKAADGELVKRETQSFAHGPRDELSLKVDLSSGDYDVWIFARGESGGSRTPRVEHLNLSDEEVRVERSLQVPASR